MRLTVAQALVRFLANQYSERDGVEQRLIAGCFGIFGHGNVAGVGQALLEAARTTMPYYLARNEQAMVHAAAGYARQNEPARRRYACTTLDRPRRDEHGHRRRAGDDQPRCRCCCCRATSSPRARASPVLQELEDPTLARRLGQRHASSPCRGSGTASTGPSSSPRALLAAMRVLTDPAETGAVTLALPQDVQAEALRLAGGAVRSAASGTCAARCPSPTRWPRRPRCCAARGAR